VPFVLYSGQADASAAVAWPTARLITKPAQDYVIIEAVAALRRQVKLGPHFTFHDHYGLAEGSLLARIIRRM
jgi:hypothetical protein